MTPVHGLPENGHDMLLNVDGRVVRVVPLRLTRPGFPTLDCFAGRHTRCLPAFRPVCTPGLLPLFILRLKLFCPIPAVHGKHRMVALHCHAHLFLSLWPGALSNF